MILLMTHYASLSHTKLTFEGTNFDIGAGNGLMPDAIKLLPKPMFTCHQEAPRSHLFEKYLHNNSETHTFK